MSTVKLQFLVWQFPTAHALEMKHLYFRSKHYSDSPECLASFLTYFSLRMRQTGQVQTSVRAQLTRQVHAARDATWDENTTKRRQFAANYTLAPLSVSVYVCLSVCVTVCLWCCHVPLHTDTVPIDRKKTSPHDAPRDGLHDPFSSTRSTERHR